MAEISGPARVIGLRYEQYREAPEKASIKAVSRKPYDWWVVPLDSGEVFPVALDAMGEGLGWK